jgi:hypothetical protein
LNLKTKRKEMVIIMDLDGGYAHWKAVVQLCTTLDGGKAIRLAWFI